MKKFVYISTIISIFALGAGASSAQDFLAPIQAKIDAITGEKDAVQAAALSEKENFEAKFASSTQDDSTSTALMQSVLENKIGKSLDQSRAKIADQFQNALLSLNNLMDRLNSRITKMQAAGTDTSSSTALVNTANADIALSTGNLSDLENLLAEPTSTSTKDSILTAIKTQSDETKTSMQAAYQSIMDLINELKQIESQSVSGTLTGNVSATSSDEGEAGTAN